MCDKCVNPRCLFAKRDTEVFYMAQIIQRIRKDGKKSYLIRVMVGYDTSGKKVIKNATFTPDKEATEKEIRKSLNTFAANFEFQAAADWKNAIDNPERINQKPNENKITFIDFIDNIFFPLYVDNGEKAPTTIAYYKAEIKRIKAFFGSVQLRYCDSIKVREYLKFLRTEYKTPSGKNIGPNTLKHCFKTLNTIFKFAFDNDYIEKNPMRGIKTPEVPKKEVDAMTSEQARTFVEGLKETSPEFRTKLYLMLTSGLRRGEVLGLQWEDIDFKKNCLTVKRQITRIEGDSIIESTPKTENSIRTVPLTPITVELLRNLKFVNKGLWVFKNRYPNTLTQEVKSYTKKIGIGDFSPHDLRHTCATLLLHNGADIQSIADLLGHAETSTTFNYYIGSDKTKVRQAISVFDNMLNE